MLLQQLKQEKKIGIKEGDIGPSFLVRIHLHASNLDVYHTYNKIHMW